jgi:hypothetical protein
MLIAGAGDIGVPDSRSSDLLSRQQRFRRERGRQQLWVAHGDSGPTRTKLCDPFSGGRVIAGGGSAGAAIGNAAIRPTMVNATRSQWQHCP